MEKQAARVMRANRAQIEMRSVDLEGLLPADHQARAVWAFVETMDLEPLYERIQAVEGKAGHPAIDPAILVALWLYATLEGVGSARALERLCEEHNAYRWIRGGVGVNHHTLADFRVAHVAYLDELLTRSVAALLASGTMRMIRVAQDGVRVRASAGASSFRRRPKLERFLAEAEAQVAALRKELDTDPGASNRRQQAAQERAARERKERVGRALTELQKIEAHRAKANPAEAVREANPAPPPGEAVDSGKPAQAQKKRRAEPRASTTDPEARVMKGPPPLAGLPAFVQCAICHRRGNPMRGGGGGGQRGHRSRPIGADAGAAAQTLWPPPPGNAGGRRLRHGGRNPGRRRVEQPRLRAR
jgi:transposase